MSTMLGNRFRLGAALCLACGLSICFAASAAADNARLGYVSADSINVRAAASPESEVIGTKEGRDYVIVTGGKGSFFEILYEGSAGYISDDFSCVFGHQTGTLKADKVILRSEPNTDSRKVTTMNRNATVNIYGEENGFYQVIYENNLGYVSCEYVDGQQSAGATPMAEEEVVLEGLLEIVSEGTPYQDKPLVERSVTPGQYTEDELYLVAQLIYAEGKGGDAESYQALASVVYNRLQSSRFPNSVEDICYQSGQFTVVKKESFRSSTPSQKALDAVISVFVEGNLSLPEGVMYFKSSRLSKDWGSSRDYYTTVGGNMYYS